MANDLPQTIDDLTHPELLKLVKAWGNIRPRQEELIWLRYITLLDETHHLEKLSSQARQVWLLAFEGMLRRSADVSEALNKGQRAFARADRAWCAATMEVVKLEKARDLAERKATRMRARMDAAFQAWQAAADANTRQAEG